MARPSALRTLIALAAVVGFTACSGPPEVHTLSGTIELIDFELTWGIRRTATATDPAHRSALEACIDSDDDDCSSALMAEVDQQAIGTDCSAGIPGPYSDVRRGAEVVIRDESDLIIALGRLGPGVVGWSGIDPHPHKCTFSFSIEGVPEATFYEAEVASHDGPRYSYQQLGAGQWTVDLSVGPWSAD